MRHLFRNKGLSIVLIGLFLFTMVGQTLTGFRQYNEGQRDHGQPTAGMGEYLKSGHFWEATAENWESEFLQMAMFVVLTACLYQKGSSESKDPDDNEPDPVDEDPRRRKHDPTAPWPVRQGGFILWLYSNSLSIAFGLLFLISFTVHGVKGAEEYNDDRREHGKPAVTVTQYMTSSQFWFESFQNWQSEFLSLWAMVVFTIYLRQKGSPESKPVAASHDENEDKKGEEEEPAEVPVAAVRS
jgi:hypothetical protein